jgi:peroxiredoxin
MRPDLARTAIIALQVLIMAAGCSPQEPPSGPVELKTGYWQAQITLPGGEIDTAFEIGFDESDYRATIINGQERIRVGEVRFSDGELTLRFPAYNNEIKAQLVDGILIGTLTLVKLHGKTQVMPFVASPGGERGDMGEREPAVVDLSGRWDAEFQKEDGTITPSIGEFAQRGSRLFGTFLNPAADHRYLSGYVSGNEFHLGTFDGAHAFIFAGTVSGDEITDAHFWSGTEFHQRWSAERDPDALLPDAYGMTYLKAGFDRFDFEFPNQDGRLISLSDDKFSGKVVIVVIAGTWCPNCHDETRFLAALHEEFRDSGLEVVGLMYEHFDDQEIAIEQIRKYREKFDIQFDTLVAGISDKTEVSKTLPSLSAVLAFPTTIFIDRNAAVRMIHTGFSGPGTGKHYEQLKEEFTRTIVELIAEPADADDSRDIIDQDT